MKTIYLDFDGVLNNYKGWQGEENLFKPRQGAECFLSTLSKCYAVYIFTTREPYQVMIWLSKHNLLQYITTVTNVKEPAHAYIDDRAIRFNGNYDEILAALEDFKPYLKANLKRIK